MEKINRILAVAFLLLLVIQPVMAYEVRSTLPGLNLWDLFVEYTFGNFWVAIIGLAILLALILMMGGISQATTSIFLMSFLFAMGVGYGTVGITVMISLLAIAMMIFSMWKMMDHGS